MGIEEKLPSGVLLTTVEKLAATPDPTSSEGQALAARLFAISRVDQVVLVLVVADMVFKPGA
jgi:hypothetical protein